MRTTLGEFDEGWNCVPLARASRQVEQVIFQPRKKSGREGCSTLAGIINCLQISECYFYALHSTKGKQNAGKFARLKMPDTNTDQIREDFELLSPSQINDLLEALGINVSLFNLNNSPSELWHLFKKQIFGARIKWEEVERNIAKVFGRRRAPNDEASRPAGGARSAQTHKIIEEIRNCGNFLQRIDTNVNELLRNGQGN